MKRLPRTRLAVLGTMAEMHLQPLAYDLARLQGIVAELAPDLLCAEITREAWEKGEFSGAAVEVREALKPLVAVSDIVLIPVIPSPEQFTDFIPSTSWRRSLAQAFNRILQWGQRKANRPEIINGVMFGIFCHTLCVLTERMWTIEHRMAWEAQNKVMAENILLAVRRDPGLRVLVTSQCQRLHVLLSLLRGYSDELEVVDYRDL